MTADLRAPATDEGVGDRDDFETAGIAVVGMAARFPGSPDIDEFWQNLVDGIDCLTTFGPNDLAPLGIRDSITRLDNFVPRGSVIEGYDRFDCERFGFSPREAAVTDPQARLLLETAHAALEHAGYDPFAVPGEVGVFAGCNPIDYALLLGRPEPTDSLTGFDQMIGNDRDFLATRISHRLGLTGPAFNVQTACSTSLVAIHLAAEQLLSHQCSMALAGGVSLNFRQGIGYFYQPGMILSPDGFCRAFDDGANGTTLGQGSGIVVLKRLEDALRDGDTVHAVLAASAINNDGSQKISYTAPSVDGQAECIATAHALADLTGDDITYVETHGTGTKLGDPVEVAALANAFEMTGTAKRHCAIGSVKTNIGHADAAAGVAGLIKAVLAVREGVIPKSLHFDRPNTAIDFENSPFFVATETRPWEPNTTDRRRAGVSSFGIGGTNAHVIVEQAPDQPSSVELPRPTLLVASAPTSDAANASARKLAEWAVTNPVGPAEASTLLHGRKLYAERAYTVAYPGQTTPGPTRTQTAVADGRLVLMFSGQGAQYAGMASGLYGELAPFSAALDEVVDAFADHAGLDLMPLLTAERGDTAAADALRQTRITQPALFAIQVAMVRQLASWGVRPDAVLGHSIGEYAAAVTAGVLSIGDGVRAVSARGALMESMKPGVMLSARLSPAELDPYLPAEVEIAAMNAPRATVAAGPHAAIEELQRRLAEAGKDSMVLATSHAFHSQSMQAAADEFTEVVRGLELHPPAVPMLSNVTGDWMADEEATNPAFWASQIRKPVRFADCLESLGSSPSPAVLCEIGPGRALSAFAAQNDAFTEPPPSVQCLGDHRESRPASAVTLEAVGGLWATGINVDYDAITGAPFTRRRPTPPSVLVGEECWLPAHRHVLALPEPGEAATAQAPTRNPVEQWCFGRSWIRTPTSPTDQPSRAVFFMLDDEAHSDLADALEERLEVIRVRIGDHSGQTPEGWTLQIGDEDGLVQLFKRLEGTSRRPDRIIMGWLDDEADDPRSIELIRHQLDRGVNTLLGLARAAASSSQSRAIHLDVLTRGAHDVLGDEPVRPAASAVAGPVKVIPLEYSGMTARQIDLPTKGSVPIDIVADAICAPPTDDPIVAIRGSSVWAHRVAPVPASDSAAPLVEGGSYLILGGLGGVGLSIAEHLASQYQARLTLTSRSGEPVANPDDPESLRRCERLAQIRENASEVITLRADVTSADDVRSVIAAAEEAHGQIDGVIMTAAVADTFGAIHRRSAEAAEQAIAAKAHGAVLLADALGDRQLDFVLLSSSIASQLYHNRFGQVGYVTANSFAEAMAESEAFSAGRVVTVAWDDWVDVGMSVRAAQDFAARHGEEISLMDEVHSFTPADGVAVFEQALRPGPATLFVSTTDLARRVSDDRHVISPFLQQAVADDELADDEGAATVSEAVMTAWSALLGISEIGHDDDFFDLGGDSLQVARMADRLSRALSVDVPLDLIFDNAAFGTLVAAIEALTDANDAADHGAATPARELTGLIELAPSQRRFFERGSPRPEHFNVSVLLRPSRPVDPDEVATAFATLEQRHSAFRTTFETRHDQWFQRVESSPTTTQVRHHDLTAASEPAAELERLAQELQAGFDLGEQPLAKIALFDLPHAEQRLLLIAHHLVVDRLSLLQVIDELDSLLAGVDLRPPTTPFSNWAAEASEFAKSTDADELVAYWQSVMPSATERLATGSAAGTRRVPDNRNDNVATIRRSLSAEDSKRLLQDRNVRADEIALIALAEGLRSWADEHGPVGVDVLGHGRRDLPTDVSRSVGFFLSYSPVWLDAHDGLDALRQQLERAWTFDLTRFSATDNTVEWVRPGVLFNYVGRPIVADEARVLDVADEAKGSDTFGGNPRDHDLAVMVAIDSADQVEITMVYNTAQFEAAHVEDLLDQTVKNIHGWPNK